MIEQGRIIDVSKNTDDGQRSSSLATTTAPSTKATWPLRGLVQRHRVADMGIEKDDTNTKINTNAAPRENAPRPPELNAMEQIEDGDDAAPLPYTFVKFDDGPKLKEASQINTNVHSKKITPSEHAFMTLHPPAQDAMEQIEEGEDAAPRPFNSAEFEDESSKLKIELCQESSDEDDGPPLPLTFSQERDSLSDAKKMAATPQPSLFNSQNDAPDATPSIGSNVAVGRDISVQQVEEHENPRYEENLQQRVVRPGNHSASDNVHARQVLSRAETNPSVPILEAYLVEANEGSGGDDGCDTVYEATPLEPELPWWKQRRTKVIMMINCVLIALTVTLSVGLGVANSRPSVDSTATNVEKTGYKCFADREELDAAVERYVAYGCGEAETAALNAVCLGDSKMYGWPMGLWCFGDVTDMSSLFEGRDMFNEDISRWNVSEVTNMNRMFFDATSFSGNVSSWDVSAVTNMREMFKGATSFNENLCEWKEIFPYGNAKDVFADSGCTIKDDPLSAYQGPFCASYCDTISPTDCFTTRDELKAAVDGYVQGDWGTAESSKYGWPIGSWCVGNVTDMSDLFEGLDTFNEDISGWDVGRVTNMSRMFYGALAFNPEDLSNWDTSSVTTMKKMFKCYEASAFNGNISSWNTSAVTDMEDMFYGAASFNPDDLSKWDTSAVTQMSGMFYEASFFNGDISSWNTSAVTDVSYMFLNATSFNPDDLSNWDTSAVTTMKSMFDGASAFNGDISSWDTSAVTDMSYMFWEASSFNQDLSKWNTSAVTTMYAMFYGASEFNGNISSWNTSAVTDMSWLFGYATSFNPADLSKWDTSAVTRMKGMFYGASAFNLSDVSNWDTSAVTNMIDMFGWATSFNQNLCSWKDSFPYSNATDIFKDSGCTFKYDPSSVTQGPFCASSCTND